MRILIYILLTLALFSCETQHGNNEGIETFPNRIKKLDTLFHENDTIPYIYGMRGNEIVFFSINCKCGKWVIEGNSKNVCNHSISCRGCKSIYSINENHNLELHKIFDYKKEIEYHLVLLEDGMISKDFALTRIINIVEKVKDQPLCYEN